MTRVTLNKVNEAIKALGGEEELARGNGYFYFVGGDTGSWAVSSVYVNSINGLTLDEWIGEYNALKTHTLR